MSPNVGNFVHDLVEMAKAMETLPQVEHERDELKAKLDDAQAHSQQLELNISDYKKQIEELQSKVRATEAERDDAELRFLELDEKAHKVLAHVAAIQAGADAVKDFLEPPKPPEPVKEPEHQVQGQGEGNPPSATSGGQSQGEGSAISSASEGATSGQSENHPTATSPAETAHGGGEQAARSEESATSPANHGPYYGKRYVDVPHYVSHEDWLAGGGTDEDYYWRPTMPAQGHIW